MPCRRSRDTQKRAVLTCAFVSKMAKKYEAVSLSRADIRGKITAYKYVLSESLGRAAERSSFGNSARSFATVVVLRVHCAQSFRPRRARRARTYVRTYVSTYIYTYIRACLLHEREKEAERQSCRAVDRFVRHFYRLNCILQM